MKIKLILLAVIAALFVSCKDEDKNISLYSPIESVGFQNAAQTVSVTPDMTQLKLNLNSVIKLDPDKGELITHMMYNVITDFAENTAVHGVHYKLPFDFSASSFLVDLYGVPPVLHIELMPQNIIKPVILTIKVPSFTTGNDVDGKSMVDKITLTLVPAK